MATSLQSSAADPPPDAADTSPLDFSKRAVPAWLNGSDSEAEVTPAPSRRMSLLSDALRSPTASQEAQFTPSGLTSGILKHGLLQEPKVCEPRPAMAAARTHFVEPEKPHRYRWSRSHSTHAPLHKSESELPAESATRRTSITFIEPRSRARSTSPRFQSTRNVFAKETAVLGIDDEDVIDDEDTIDDKDAVDDELADESSESDEAADNDKEAADKHSDDQESDSEAAPSSTRSPAPLACSAQAPVALTSPPLTAVSTLSVHALPLSTSSPRRRTLSFHDVTEYGSPKDQNETAQPPRRRSLAFAISPHELRERDRLQSMHRRQVHGKRCMVASPGVSSSSSLVTNLFDTPWPPSTCGSTGTAGSGPNEPSEHRLHVRSPHLVKARLPSPIPSPHELDDDEDEEGDDDEDDEDDEDEGDDEDDDEDDEDEDEDDEDEDEEKALDDLLDDDVDLVMAAADQDTSLSRAKNDADDALSSMDPCVAWASQSTDMEECPLSPAPVAVTDEPALCCEHSHRRPTSHRGSVIQSLLITEPTMQYSGSYTKKLDTTDELVLAAELLLLHKSPELDEERATFHAMPTFHVSSDEEEEEESPVSSRFPQVPRRPHTCAPLTRECSPNGSLLSPHSSGVTSPQSLSFRRTRDLSLGRYPPGSCSRYGSSSGAASTSGDDVSRWECNTPSPQRALFPTTQRSGTTSMDELHAPSNPSY